MEAIEFQPTITAPTDMWLPIPVEEPAPVQAQMPRSGGAPLVEPDYAAPPNGYVGQVGALPPWMVDSYDTGTIALPPATPSQTAIAEPEERHNQDSNLDYVAAVAIVTVLALSRILNFPSGVAYILDENHEYTAFVNISLHTARGPLDFIVPESILPAIIDQFQLRRLPDVTSPANYIKNFGQEQTLKTLGMLLREPPFQSGSYTAPNTAANNEQVAFCLAVKELVYEALAPSVTLLPGATMESLIAEGAEASRVCLTSAIGIIDSKLNQY